MSNKSTVDPLLTPPSPSPQVPKEVFVSFKVSHIKNNEIVLRSLTAFARKKDLKISLTAAL